MNYMKTVKNIGVILILTLSLSSSASASWWNPISWFNKKTEVVKTLPVRHENVVPVAETKKEGASTTNTITSNKAQKTNQNALKTNDQICQGSYGLYSMYSGQKNDKGGLVCSCKDGYDWSSNRTSCIKIPQITTKTCPNGEIISALLVCKDMEIISKVIIGKTGNLDPLALRRNLIFEQMLSQQNYTGLYTVNSSWSQEESKKRKDYADYLYSSALEKIDKEQDNQTLKFYREHPGALEEDIKKGEINSLKKEINNLKDCIKGYSYCP